MGDQPPKKRQRTGALLAKDALTGDASTWKGLPLTSVEQVTPAGLKLVMDYADRCKRLVEEGAGSCELLKGKIMAAVFYEASTRTNCSFQAAMLRMGGTVIPVDSSSSSAKKGETLSDTIKCLECYCDVLVLRHPVKGSADEAAAAASIPVLNAGDGTGEHPTQALLDLYTIRAELGGDAPCGKTVSLVGDLKNGRTVHSLAMLLSRGDFQGLRLSYISPPELRMPDYIKQHISTTCKGSVEQAESSNLAEALPQADVVYVTRVQKERFENEADYEKVKGVYVLTSALLKAHAKEKMAVLHPLPRVDEIATDCDDDPRAAYFRQMRNGMYVRMALLGLVLGVPPP